MRAGRGRVVVTGLAGGVALLFAGRWISMVLADRWWAETVAPDAARFLGRWHLLEMGLEIGGILVAGAWCVGHFVLVVRSIGTVQVPRRLGDLEIREILNPTTLRLGAVVAGGLLGIVIGSGGAQAAPLVAQAWQGARHGVVDPVLGLDLGIYLAQLPLWDMVLASARTLVWAALIGAALCHFAVGGARVGRSGLAMTESARLQLGLLIAAALLLATMSEALAPLRTVAGLEDSSLSALPPAARWSVAGAWCLAAIAVGIWAIRPWPPLVIGGLGLWAGTGLLSHLVAPTMPPRAFLPAEATRPIAALATGLDRIVEAAAPDEGGAGRPPGAGLWSGEALARLLESNGGTLRALSPVLLDQAGERVPVWLALRTTTDGAEVSAIAEDRLGTGGVPISYREGDRSEYPGVVSWRRLEGVPLFPGQRDTVAPAGPGGLRLGSAGRRLLLAWGTQAAGTISGAGAEDALWWRMAPRERAARLFPPAWWDEARAVLVDDRLVWVVDGWLTLEGAPFAPAIPWEGGSRRYARPAFQAVIDATSGATTFYLRDDADALARGWAAAAPGMFLPADSAPPVMRTAHHSARTIAVQGWALLHGAYDLRIPGAPSRSDSVLLQPTAFWTPEGAAFELPVGDYETGGRFGGRLRGILIGRAGAPATLVRWREGSAPPRSRTLEAMWQRFASYERLQDSIGAAGGRILTGPVRYEVGPQGTLAVQVLYLAPAQGAPAVGWVNLARIDRLGAARTPATAWANLRGESAPVVPAPESPDAIAEARRWAARADSALRAGDLEGFGRAFAALKRVLGTP
jgi:uncharacterized protein UPF0182